MAGPWLFPVLQGREGGLQRRMGGSPFACTAERALGGSCSIMLIRAIRFSAQAPGPMASGGTGLSGM